MWNVKILCEMWRYCVKCEDTVWNVNVTIGSSITNCHLNCILSPVSILNKCKTCFTLKCFSLPERLFRPFTEDKSNFNDDQRCCSFFQPLYPEFFFAFLEPIWNLIFLGVGVRASEHRCCCVCIASIGNSLFRHSYKYFSASWWDDVCWTCQPLFGCGFARHASTKAGTNTMQEEVLLPNQMGQVHSNLVFSPRSEDSILSFAFAS